MNEYLWFLGLEEKLLKLGTDKKKQSITHGVLYRRNSLRFDIRSAIKAPKVKDFILGLEIRANSFRTNIATGKIFPPLCFFCKGTPNYVRIDLKKSHSNLTLVNASFTTGQCQRRRNFVQLYTIRHVLMRLVYEMRVFILLYGYSGSKGNYYKRNQCSVRKGYF